MKKLEQVNKTQADSLKLVSDSKDATSEVMKPLLESLAANEKRLRSMQANLYNLAQTNEAIKNFLGINVPPDIGGMLNSARSRETSSTDAAIGVITAGK